MGGAAGMAKTSHGVTTAMGLSITQMGYGFVIYHIRTLLLKSYLPPVIGMAYGVLTSPPPQYVCNKWTTCTLRFLCNDALGSFSSHPACQ